MIMTLRELFDRFFSECAAVYGDQEGRSVAYILVEHTCGATRTDIMLTPRKEVIVNDLGELLTQIKESRPIQYITGTAYFCDMDFRVDERVLIPRPETEELVRLVAKDLRKCGDVGSKRVVDIGTGSGAIAIALASQFADCKVFAIDVSNDALEIAQANATKNRVAVEFFNIDIFSDDIFTLGCDKFDVIVSNPPYVLDSERAVMRKNVLDFEPELALFVPDDDPLKFYNRIAELGSRVLNCGGRLYFEINEQFGNQIVEMLRSEGYENVTLHQDIFDKNRMVSAIWNRE